MKKIAFIICFVFSISLFAQEDVIESEFKIELGINRSELPFALIKTEKITGGVGWNANLIYTLHKEMLFGETGIGYRNLEFLIPDNMSSTGNFTAKASSISIPILIGTNFIKRDRKVLPILKTGINLDYTFYLNTVREDVLIKPDLRSLNLTYNISAGIRINKVEFLISYNRDINKYIKTINKNISYIGLKVAYGIFSK